MPTKIDQILKEKEFDRLAKVPIEYMLSIQISGTAKEAVEVNPWVLKFGNRDKAIENFQLAQKLVADSILLTSNQELKTAVITLFEVRSSKVVAPALMHSTITNNKERKSIV